MAMNVQDVSPRYETVETADITCGWVAHNQCGLQASLGTLYRSDPSLDPECLKLYERFGHPVVCADNALGVLASHQRLVLRKPEC